MQFVRRFSSVPRKHPLVLRDLGTGRTAVTFSASPGAVPMGEFATALRAQVEPAFTLQPDPRGEPEILLEKPQQFAENRQFWPRAAEILKQHIHRDPVFGDLVAAETRTRFFHIYDLRLPPLFGRIPEVEDILGTVELDIASDLTKIVPASFEPNAMYRPVTQYGAMLVSPYLHQALAQGLR